MTLPLDAIGLVLLAALCHACWNAVIKIGADRVVVLAVVNLVGAVLALLVLPFVEVPAAQAWPWLIASVAVHALYYYFKESFGPRRVLASVLVAGGLILLNTS